MDEAKSGIYMILNTVNDKKYIGSSINLKSRKYVHFRELRKNIHKNNHLQNAYNKYGGDKFIFKVIEYVDRIECISDFKKVLLDREQYWLDYYNGLYNILPTAGSPLGHRDSVVTREKKRKAMLGRKITEEWRNKISRANKGRIPTKETLEKAREVNKNKSPWNKGLHMSDKTKQKIGLANKGRKHTEETIERMRITSTGRRHTDETKNKIASGKHKRVVNLTTGEVFDNMKSAVEKYNLSYGNLSMVCRGLRKTTGGYKWSYYEGYSNA